MDDIAWIFLGDGSEWFWTALQFLVVSITLFLIYLQIRQQSQSNAVQVLDLLKSKWRDNNHVLARYRICDALCNGTKAFQKDFKEDFSAIPSFFEELGVYVRKGCIDTDIVWELYSASVEFYTTLFLESILELRREFKDNSLYDQVVYLDKLMRKHGRRKKVPTFERTKEEILKFARVELKSAKVFLTDSDMKNLSE